MSYGQPGTETRLGTNGIDQVPLLRDDPALGLSPLASAERVVGSSWRQVRFRSHTGRERDGGRASECCFAASRRRRVHPRVFPPTSRRGLRWRSRAVLSCYTILSPK